MGVSVGVLEGVKLEVGDKVPVGVKVNQYKAVPVRLHSLRVAVGVPLGVTSAVWVREAALSPETLEEMAKPVILQHSISPTIPMTHPMSPCALGGTLSKVGS